jgi:hypothetical protein
MGLNQICPIFPSESLYIKSMFFELFGAYLEGNAVSSTKGCASVCHYKMQCMTKVIQKLDAKKASKKQWLGQLQRRLS